MGLLRRRFWEKGENGGRNGFRVDAKRRNNRACLEPLEPRILLSADLAYSTAGSAHDLTLRMSDVQGVETLQLVNNANNSVVASQAAADTSQVVITGSGPQDSLNVDFTNPFNTPVVFSGSSPSDNDALTVMGGDNTWNITGHDTGTVDNISFSGIGNLASGSNNEDTFVIGQNGSVSGLIDGAGLGTVVIDGNYASEVFTATGPHSGSIGLDGNTIDYAGMAPVASTGTSPNIEFDLTSGEQGIIENGSQGLGLYSKNGTFESTTFNLPGAGGKLTIGGQADSIEVATSLTMAGASLDINAKSITVDPNVTIDTTGTTNGSITLDAEAVTTGGINGTGLLANAISSITVKNAVLKGGTVSLIADSQVAVNNNGMSITGVKGSVITSAPTAEIDINGSQVTGANITLTSSIEDSLQASATGDTVKLVTISGSAEPEVLIEGSSQITASGSLTATASSNATIDATASPGSSNADDSSVDAAVVDTTFGSGATLEVTGGAVLKATGAATLSSESTLNDTTFANADVANTAGAAVAVSVVSGDTSASIQGATVYGSSVTLSAASTRTITTTALSSPGGSSSSGNGSNQSEQTLKNKNAGTSDGSITVAGAIAVNTDTGTTSAFVENGTINAGTGVVTISATPQDTVALVADGEFTGDTSSTDGVGVAVAIDAVDRTNLSYVGGNSTVTAGSLAVEVLAPANGSSFSVQATSGVGNSSQVGVAGSLAVNVVVTDNTSYVDNNATLTLVNSPNVTIEALSDVTNTTTAVPAAGSGSASTSTGVGASVAFTDAEDTTAAYVGDNVTLSGAKNLSLTAVSTHYTSTQAENGAKGGTAVTPVVAISVADDNAYATLGIGATLNVGGDFKESSSLNNGVRTEADGNTGSSDTGVGISIALTIVNDSSLATLNRNLVSGGVAAFMSSTISESESDAKSSVAGAQGKNSDSSGKDVDQKKNDQQGYADKTAKGLDNQAEGSEGAQSPSASTSDGSVSVAAGVAVNLENATSKASIPDGRSVTAAGMVTVQSAANADGRAVADGSATTGGGSSSVGVGAAVAVNANNITNLAYVGNNTVISGGGLTVGAVMADHVVNAPVVDANVVNLDNSNNATFANDSIYLGLDAGLATGDEVEYDAGSGTAIGGLTSQNSYFVNVGDDGTIGLYDTKDHAEAGAPTAS